MTLQAWKQYICNKESFSAFKIFLVRSDQTCSNDSLEFRCMLVGSSLTVQGLQWNYLQVLWNSPMTAPWDLHHGHLECQASGESNHWNKKEFDLPRSTWQGVHVLFSRESISDHNMIQIYLDTCWSYPKLRNHFSIDHPRWGARHPWQSFGRSLGTVQHHGFGFLQTWHTVVQKMVKRCWKMMRSKWYQI